MPSRVCEIEKNLLCGVHSPFVVRLGSGWLALGDEGRRFRFPPLFLFRLNHSSAIAPLLRQPKPRGGWQAEKLRNQVV